MTLRSSVLHCFAFITYVGCVRTAAEANGHEQINRLDDILYTVQNDLFELGADLATCASLTIFLPLIM